MNINKLFETGNKDVYIIAEVSQTHDGSLGQAHAFIDAAAKTGVDAIKFQTHIADAESTLEEPFRVKFSYEDNTRYDYWKRMEFTREQWVGLKNHAEEKGLDFLSSPFSLEAVDLLEEIGIVGWKVGSGEVYSKYLLERMAQTGKPVIISSGMSTYENIKEHYDSIKKYSDKVGIVQCTTSYPSSFEAVGLNVIDKLIADYDCPIGLSDHSGTIYPALAAVARGAKIVEVHITLSPYMFGPDVSSSVTVDELTELVKGVRAITTMLNHEVDKTVLPKQQADLKQIFAKGLYAAGPIAAGEEITLEKVRMKKPLKGIPAEQYESVIGKKAVVAIDANTPIESSMLEQ
ncbi:MAG: N-acetylneuraminate synthase family protein [Lachnospiraceae bacterium]|nr:N-acetylneuraminate synthase family protein [Lachnospiraceae bacterium]